jgi:hypothetical protein
MICVRLASRCLIRLLLWLVAEEEDTRNEPGAMGAAHFFLMAQVVARLSTPTAGSAHLAAINAGPMLRLKR